MKRRLLIALLPLAASSASAQSGRDADSLSASSEPGVGESHWGPIEAPTSANTDVESGKGKPTWEHVVNAPYYVIAAPFWLVFKGAELGAGYVAESPSAQWIRNLFPVEAQGAYITPSASYSTQNGIGVGLSGYIPNFLTDGGIVNAKFGITSAGKGKATTGLVYPKASGSVIQVGGGYRNDINARYYGLGPGSSGERESFFRQESSWIGASYTRFFGSRNWLWEVDFLFSGIAANGTDKSQEPQLSEEFAAALPSGYRDRSDGRSVALELSHDDTDRVGRLLRESGRPDRGGIRRAKVTYFQGTGDVDVDFLTYRAELQQFVGLWHTRRVLALRGVFSTIDRTRGGEVPFQRLLTNDQPDRFRGYNDERFRDRGLFLLTAEYRWPIWALETVNGVGVDTYVFGDWGQVFPGVETITMDNMTLSLGGGFRVVGNGRFKFVLEGARADESWQFRFAAEQPFQWDKGALFFGDNPIPAR